MEDEPLSLGEAFRTIFAIRTLRRLFVSDIISGLGQASALFTIFYYSEVYGLGTLGLYFVFVPAGITTIVAGFIAGRYVDRLIAVNPPRVLSVYGGFSLLGALGLFLQSRRSRP